MACHVRSGPAEGEAAAEPAEPAGDEAHTRSDRVTLPHELKESLLDLFDELVEHSRCRMAELKRFAGREGIADPTGFATSSTTALQRCVASNWPAVVEAFGLTSQLLLPTPVAHSRFCDSIFTRQASLDYAISPNTSIVLEHASTRPFPLGAFLSAMAVNALRQGACSGTARGLTETKEEQSISLKVHASCRALQDALNASCRQNPGTLDDADYTLDDADLAVSDWSEESEESHESQESQESV
jgi:hypothetical protein